MEIQTWRSWRRDARGTMAVVWTLAMLALMMVMGLALDGAALVNNKQHIQEALDRASLMGARALIDSSLTEEQVETTIAAAFHSNIATARGDLECTKLTINLDFDLREVDVGARCSLPTTLGGQFYPERAYLADHSKAKISIARLDLAMVLDVSGSMAGFKLETLQNASKQAARTLMNAGEDGEVRVSIAPYASSINVGIYGPYVMGQEADLEYIEDHDPSSPPRYCVHEREGIAAWDDRPPGTGMYFSRPGYSCVDNEVLPLTPDFDVLESAIDDLRVGGRTAGHLGVAWGWYTLSPQWSEVWPDASEPMAYNEDNSLKVMILMTDGTFNRRYVNSQGTSSVQAIKLCDAMRDEGIIIVSVAFMAPEAGKRTLRDCAGDEALFFDASDANALTKTYNDITNMLLTLRLVE